LQFVSLIFW